MAEQSLPDEVAKGLRTTGLGARYRNRRFEDCGEIGLQFRDWYHDEAFKPDLRAGMGRHLYGGTNAHDLFMVTARACYLRGVHPRVITLSMLAIEAAGSEISTDLLEAHAIFLSSFYRDDMEMPLSDFQRLAVEDFLMERMDNARAVFTLGSAPLDAARAWWSRSLIERMQSINTQVSVP